MRNFLLISLFLVISSSIIKGQPINSTFVLVHGSWHGEWAYYKIEALLQNAGQKVICVNLPGHGIDRTEPGQVTLQDYQDAITNVLDTITGQAILVAHSMGGIAISMAAEARPEKVCKLIYIAAFMLKSGHSLLEMSMKDTASLVGPNLIFDFDHNVVDVNRDHIRQLFYNHTNKAKFELAEKLLTPEPLQPAMTTLNLTDENYGSIPRFYISTLDDHTITPDSQYEMYKELPLDNIYYISSDHSPFLSAPKKLKRILLKISRKNTVEVASLKSANNDNFPVAHNEFVNNTLVAQNEQNTFDIENDMKIYVGKMKQFCIESTEQIFNCSIKFYSLTGILLEAYNSHPESFRVEFPLDNIHENYIIAVVNINGETVTRKIFLYH
jgi:pimeloyl-ACP methyl ester carboxylesterase